MTQSPPPGMDPGQGAQSPPSPSAQAPSAPPPPPSGTTYSAAPPPPPPAAAGPGAPAFDISSITSRLSQAELLLVGGALIILLIELLMGVFLAEYFIGDAPLLLSAGILALVWLHKTGRAQIASYTTLLIAAGAGLGVLGVDQILTDVRQTMQFSSDVMTWIGRVAYYAGTLLAAFGAYVLARASRLGS